MSLLTIKASHNYDVIIGADILSDIGKYLKTKFPQVSPVIISDDNVYGLYGDTVVSSLTEAGYKVSRYLFPQGEKSKSTATLIKIWEFLASEQITRGDLIIALGGGVVGDIAGFAAATYLRGIPYIQVPTTLLAAVDSSVGGKTAVNLEAGKNLAGAFYQPSLVYCDYNTMKTLTPDRFADGVSEAIKYGILRDKELFNTLAQGKIWDNIEKIIIACLKIKADLVAADEFDRGQRQLLNLGHTIGHAIEKTSDFTITHGHAVAIGMALIAEIAVARTWADADTANKIKSALTANDLPLKSPYSIDALAEVIKRDKKRLGDTINFVIPQEIGHCQLYSVNVKDLLDFLKPIGE